MEEILDTLSMLNDLNRCVSALKAIRSLCCYLISHKITKSLYSYCCTTIKNLWNRMTAVKQTKAPSIKVD